MEPSRQRLLLEQQRDQHLARAKQCTGKQHKQLRRRLMQKVGKINAQLKSLAGVAAQHNTTTTSTATSNRAAKRRPTTGNDAPAGLASPVDAASIGGAKRPKPSSPLGTPQLQIQPKPEQPRQATAHAPPHHAKKKKKKVGSKRTRFLNQQIAAYAQRKELGKALAVFEGAKTKGIADVHTYTNTLNAQIRCGQLEAAERTFADLLGARGLTPNVVSFTVMLKGYTNNGLITEARDLLRRMSTQCHPPITPNVRTANTFVRGCLRVGAIADAEWALHHMLEPAPPKGKGWGVEPDRSTYTAVVTLMCQALRLHDAERLVELVASLPMVSHGSGGGGGGGGDAGGEAEPACVVHWQNLSHEPHASQVPRQVAVLVLRGKENPSESNAFVPAVK